MRKDYHKILGVSPRASKDDIKTAFRNLARKYHPDINKSADATVKFKEIAEAYEALTKGDGQPETQPRNYADVEDIFANFFGNEFRGNKRTRPPRPKPRAVIPVNIPVTLAARGGNANLMEDGQRIFVFIPSGTKNDDKIRIDSAQTKRVLNVKIVDDDKYRFRKDGSIEMDLRVSFLLAVVGGDVLVEAPNGDRLTMSIPPKTPSHTAFRLKKVGLAGSDLYIRLGIDIPSALSDDEMKIIREIAAKYGIK